MAPPLKPHSNRKRRRSQSPPPPNPSPELVEDASHKKTKIEGSWRNLDLILSLQSKDLPLQRKIDLAFDFVRSDANCGDGGQGPVSVSRLVAFLGDWIQFRLTNVDKESKSLELTGSCLDFRCWVVLRFCLERSSLVVSPNLLKSIACVLRHASSASNEDDPRGYNQLFEQALECLKLVFSSKDKAFHKAAVELWVSCSAEVTNIVPRILSNEESSQSSSAEVLLSLSSLLLEHFASFLRFHPNPKNIFLVFVDRLLEPLLEFLVLLHLKTGASKYEQSGCLVKIVEDVVSNGLFHPVHISGFSSLRNSNVKQEARELKGINQSYHRHFFQQLEKIIRERKAAALGGFGYLLRLFISRVKAREGTSLLSKGDQSLSKGIEVSPEARESSKPAFDVFMQLMEPLLFECKRFAETEFLGIGEVLEIRLIEAHCMLKSVKEILASFIQEKLYARLEDSDERTHFNFLKNICSITFSISEKINQLWSSALKVDDGRLKRILRLLVTEVIVILRNFLEIEHKVVGDDLVSLWVMLLSSVSLYVSVDDAKPSSSLNSEIIKFGCQLIDVYSEHRQVSNPLFALCKAMRLLAVSLDAVSAGYLVSPSSSLSSTVCLKSVATLFESQEFQLAITNGIRSIPEGQSSGCIQQLIADMADLLEWLRLGSVWSDGEKLGEANYTTSRMPDLDFQAEITGRFFSEIYADLLNFLPVTATNSVVIGNSVENLMNIIRPTLSTLVKNQSNSVGDFIVSVTGRKLSDGERDECGTGFWTRPRCMTWVFVFFFRMYISCRHLHPKLISLMPPDLSRKASEAMGSSFAMSCGSDWRMCSPDWLVEGYFSWLARPSIALADIIQNLSELFISGNPGGCAPLVYVLHVMAMQRLVELNRQIKAFEFRNHWDSGMVKQQLVKDSHSRKLSKKWKRLGKKQLLKHFYFCKLSKKWKLQIKHSKKWDLRRGKKQLLYDSHGRKSSKKWKQHVKDSIKEAKDLTNFLTSCLSSMSSALQYTSRNNDRVSESEEISSMSKDHWDLVVCSLNENSLPIAIWWLLCKNTDTWCIHATSEKLKKFLSLLISYSLPYISAAGYVKELIGHRPICRKILSMHSISCEFLCDTVLHEEAVLHEHFASGWGLVMKKSLYPIAVPHDEHSLPNSLLSSELHCQENTEKQSSSWGRVVVRTSESLLNLLNYLVVLHVNARSSSSQATYVLNLEKLVLSCLQSYGDDCFLYDPYDLFGLFLSCRRTLRHFIVGYVENLVTRKHSSAFPLSEYPTILWLFESVSELAKLPHKIFGANNSRRVKDMIIALIDNTACIFEAMSKREMFMASPFLIKDVKLQKELPMDDGLDNADIQVEVDQHSDMSESFNAWKHVQHMAEILNEWTGRLLISLRRCIPAVGAETVSSNLKWDALSSPVACIQGFLWGVASTLDSMCKDCSAESTQSPTLLPLRVSSLSNLIDVFENFVDVCLNILLCDNMQTIKAVNSLRNLPEVDRNDDEMNLDIVTDGTHEAFLCDTMVSSGNLSAPGRGCDQTDAFRYRRAKHEELSSLGANCAFNFGSMDSVGMEHLKGSLVDNLHQSEPPLMAFALRQLFIASAAILKLRCMAYLPRAQTSQADCVNLMSSSVGIIVATSLIVLQEMAETSGWLDPSQFIRLDGVLCYLEVFGGYFDIMDPGFCKDVYPKIIDTHLRAIGKCISLQRKAANISSQEANSSTKMLQSQKQSMDNNSIVHGHGICDINVLKSRLRMSFKIFIRKPPKLHLLTTIKALERALIGVHNGSNVVDEITTGNLHGGKVSSSVAAGIDCLDLVLDVFSGRKKVVKRNMSNLVAAVLNIIIHLRNPRIFDPENNSEDAPDPGAVVLMCVGILTKVAGGHSYILDSWHVSQCIHMPAALFQNFHHLGASWTVDRQFAINLYAACCRLLCTTIKHRKWLTIQLIALVEDSTNTLLNLLEFVDADLVKRKKYFFWEVEEAVKCASFFRRIYEEIRQQKDVYGRYSFHFLSAYICVYSGYGALKAGIKREVDEELRPGIYSLIDICKPTDLQQLHTALNDAPCRSTLANLLHDYRLHFQYEGKI